MLLSMWHFSQSVLATLAHGPPWVRAVVNSPLTARLAPRPESWQLLHAEPALWPPALKPSEWAWQLPMQPVDAECGDTFSLALSLKAVVSVWHSWQMPSKSGLGSA